MMRWSPGCVCCAEGCQEFTVGFTPSSPLSRGEYDHIPDWQPLTIYFPGTQFKHVRLLDNRMSVWQVGILQVQSGPGWTAFEESRYAFVEVIDYIDGTDEWHLFGSGWDALDQEQTEEHLLNGWLTQDMGYYSKEDILPSVNNWSVAFNLTSPNETGFIVRWFAQATGEMEPDSYYYASIEQDIPDVLIYEESPGKQQDPFTSNIKQRFGERQNNADVLYDASRGVVEKRLCRFVQPDTAHVRHEITLPNTLNPLGAEPAVRNYAYLCENDGDVVIRPGEVIPALAGDVVVLRDPYDYFNAIAWEVIAAQDLVLEDRLFGGANVLTRSIADGADFSGRRIGVFCEQSFGGKAIFTGAYGSLAESISTLDCDPCFSAAIGCLGDYEDSWLPMPIVGQDTVVHDKLHPPGHTLFFQPGEVSENHGIIGNTFRRIQVNWFQGVKVTAYSSIWFGAFPGFGRPNEYHVRLSVIFEMLTWLLQEGVAIELTLNVQAGAFPQVRGITNQLHNQLTFNRGYTSQMEAEIARDDYLLNLPETFWDMDTTLIAYSSEPIEVYIPTEQMECLVGTVAQGVYDTPIAPVEDNPVIGESWTMLTGSP